MSDKPVQVQLSVWMREHKATDGNIYLEIGKVEGKYKTLLVTLKNGNGGALMFCEIHQQVYPIVHAACEGCRNAPREEPTEASATSCGSPEFQR